MNFWKLKGKHKKWFIINQLIVISLLIVMLFVAWAVNKVELPTSTQKISASTGFVTGVVILLLAVLNRISVLFKVRSMGFIVFFILFLTIKLVIDVMIWATGLIGLIILLDDVIMVPIWNNIWYNEYDNHVVIDNH